MSDQPTTPYGGEFTVKLTGWERRQLALLVENSMHASTTETPLRVGLGRDFPKLEAERQTEWLADLLRKLLPDER